MDTTNSKFVLVVNHNYSEVLAVQMRKLDESDVTLLRYLSNALASAPERSEELVETVIDAELSHNKTAKNRKNPVFSILNDLKEIFHESANITAMELTTAAERLENKAYKSHKRAGYILRRAVLRQSLRGGSKMGVAV